MNTINKRLTSWELIEFDGESVVIKNVDKKNSFYVYLSDVLSTPTSADIGFPVDKGDRIVYVADGRYLYASGNSETDVVIS